MSASGEDEREGDIGEETRKRVKVLGEQNLGETEEGGE